MPYDPFVKLKRIQRIVCKGIKRKYYRFRSGKWYGGIATADCCGCILKCIFCWSDYPRDNPDKVGKF
ncbi:molybdenum cofactor biosynthesis protein MoaA, partial [archaeon]